MSVGEKLSFGAVGRLAAAKPLIDRSKFPTADDEYTPQQRRLIDARLAESTEDIGAGRLHGPFETHEEMVQFLHQQTKKARGKVRSR